MDSNQTQSGLKNDNSSLFPKKPKKNYCLIIAIVIGALILIGGIIVLIIVFALKKGDNSNEKPIKNVNISYYKNELKIFDIQKNISSTIYGENENKEESSTFYYKCALGIKNKIEEVNSSNYYLEGFFAILNTIYYNKTTLRNKTIRDNKELYNIITKKNNKKNLLRNLQKMDNNELEEENIKPILKVVFYKNGSYKNIYRPINLSEKSYNEMKEMLDIILPKISNDTLVDKIDSETIQNKIKEKQLANLKAKALKMNQNNKFNYIKIKRKLDENEDEDEDENGLKIKGKNSTEEYYIDCNMSHYTDLEDDDEKNNITRLDNPKDMGNNVTKLDTF